MGRMKELLDQRLEENKYEMYEQLKNCVLLIDAMMPGVLLIAFSEFELLNETLIKTRKILRKIEKL